jgi:hypothetical protein
MSQITHITHDKITNLAESLFEIRNSDKPEFSLKKAVFDTASDFLQILEQINDRIRENKLITKRIGKRHQFRPWIGGWWENDNERRHLWLGFEITMEAKYKNIKNIGTALYLFNNNKGKYDILTVIQDEKGNHIGEVYKYPKNKDLHFEEYCTNAIAFWEKGLRG